MPQTCKLYGYVIDFTGAPISDVAVKITFLRGKNEYKSAAGALVFNPALCLTANSNGYFECRVLPSSLFQGGASYQIEIVKGEMEMKVKGSSKLCFEVPDGSEYNITSLLSGIA